MYNWISELLRKITTINMRLSKGTRRKQLATAIIAAALVYLSGSYLAMTASSLLSGDAFGIILFVIALCVLVVSIIVTYSNFARWISDHEEKTDEALIAEAKLQLGQVDDPAELIKHIK